MNERPAVVLALTPVAEHAIEAQLFGPNATLEPRASVAEADELEAESIAVDARAVLLSPALSGLTPGHCARVRARGLRLIGIALDQREHEALLDLAVDEIASYHDPAALLAAIAGTDHTATVRLLREPTSRDADTRIGNVVAVVGAKGSPGASELAASLAALAAQRWSCLLLELDLLGGGLDVRLGADPQSGSLLGLLRASEADDEGLRDLLERWLTTQSGWLPVLLGPPDLTAAAAELAQPGAVTACLRALARVYPLCIVDTGYLLGSEPELPTAARAHREALISADAVVLVLGARDQQLRAGLAQLDLLLDQLDLKPERLRVILNGLGGPGSNPDRAIEPALQRRLGERGLALDAHLPWDARGLQHPRGSYTNVLQQLIEELFLPVTPTPRSRKRKLAPPETVTRQEEVALPWRS